MIACHLGMSEITDTIIVSFHMSAFFIISGYLHRSGKWWPAIKKTAKRLLIPVPFFNLLGYCIWLFQNIDMPFSIKEYITKPYLRIILTMHIPADTRSAFPVISVQSPVSIQCCWQS